MTNLEIIEKYENYLRGKHSAEKITETVKAYPQKITYMFEFLGCFDITRDNGKNSILQNGEKRITDLTMDDLLELNTWLRDIKKYKATSHNAYIYALRNFLNYCRLTKKLDIAKADIEDMFQHEKVMDGDNSGQTPINSDKYYKLMEMILSLSSGTYITDRRNALIVLALTTGLRRKEIANLKKSDIDFKNMICSVYDTKGFKPRQVPITDYVKRLLLKLYDSYEEQGIVGEYVFMTSTSKKMHKNNVGRIVGWVMNLAVSRGILEEDEVVSPHGLRKTMATYLSNAGMSDGIIIETLGHSTNNQLKKYVKKQDQSNMDALRDLLSVKEA